MHQESINFILEKTKKDYAAIAQKFSSTRENLWTELIELRDYVKDGDRVLDLGCGNGRIFELFSDKKIEYSGVDISSELIALAREKYPQLDFKVGDILDLPFAENQFDAVFCIAVLHHLPSKELRQKALLQIKKVLKENGVLILTVWNLWQKKYFQDLVKYTLKKILGQVKIEGHVLQLDFGDVFIPFKGDDRIVQRYIHAFRKNELQKEIFQAGFKIEKIKFLSRESRNVNLLVVCRK